jgi:hypothetical protein
MVIAVLNKNTEIAQQAICKIAKGLKTNRECECDQALASALITNPEVISLETRQKLDLLVKKYLE